MEKVRFFILLLLGIILTGFPCPGQSLLIPMDQAQSDHCRGYGLTFQALTKNASDVCWLINYRGGSFLLPDDPAIRSQAEKMGVSFEPLAQNQKNQIFDAIAEENMDVVTLEIAPRIAIYLPNPAETESDVVAQTLIYSGISFKTIFDEEILQGKLSDYDWLHIHHKDFTGTGHRRGPSSMEKELAAKLKFSKVWQMKQAVADQIRQFVGNGGFLFAMCSAAETIDISLAAHGVDIAHPIFDGDPSDPAGLSKLDYSRSLAFENFQVTLGMGRKYSDIDVPSAGVGTMFRLFSFSAKVNPIPCLLNQNHTDEIPGFDGETTSFRRSMIKKNVTILGENNDGVSVRYLCGTHQKGVFCFYGGHTPDQKMRHLETRAPGFRLILNNVLFPAAKIKKRKT